MVHVRFQASKEKETMRSARFDAFFKQSVRVHPAGQPDQGHLQTTRDSDKDSVCVCVCVREREDTKTDRAMQVSAQMAFKVLPPRKQTATNNNNNSMTQKNTSQDNTRETVCTTFSTRTARIKPALGWIAANRINCTAKRPSNQQILRAR